jgi:hypothetical protein
MSALGKRRPAGGAESARRRIDTPVRVARRVRVPGHDLVDIDRLGLGAPVAINAEARLRVDEGRAVAAGAVVAIGHGSLVGAVGPHINAATDVMGRVEAHAGLGLVSGPGSLERLRRWCSLT